VNRKSEFVNSKSGFVKRNVGSLTEVSFNKWLGS